MKNILLIVFSFFCLSIYSQKNESIENVIKSYDIENLQNLEKHFELKNQNNLSRAKKYAEKYNLPLVKFNKDGSFDDLMGIEKDSTLLYYSIDNQNAANSTRTTFLNNNFNLKGSNMLVGVWDGGPARTTHQEFGGRAFITDASSLNGNSFHATHVTGTIAASGVNPQAKGMAPLVRIRTFDWFNDETEVLNQVQQGMLISNHSYGVPIQNTSAWYIGAYSSASRDWDLIAYNSPYYLAVFSAGNNGGDVNSSPSTPGFDKLTGEKTSKNNLVVANAQQATINSNGELVSVAINSSSSQGPADDGRIKPDIAGQGSSLFSAGDASDTAYLTLSGTSMAAPNVAGSLILLQEYYNQKNNRYMKAATLKGLVCHTADDAGNPGPDAKFGWGLLNCKKAGETIFFNGLTGVISENRLNQGETKTYTFVASGTTPFSATLCWTDPAGQANTGTNNSTARALVNDLDLRITQNTNVFYPWRLQTNASLNATRNSDNNVDNVESVKIDTPSNTTYTVTVTNKNSLQGGFQDFSLIVTGIQSSFAINALTDEKVVCNTQSATYSFDFKNLDFNSVSVVANSLPSGAIATFSQNSLFVDEVFTMTISNLTNVPAGTYNITVQGTKGTEVKNTIVKLIVYNTNFTNVTYSYPLNNDTNVAQNSVFMWQTNPNTTSYIVQVATDVSFSNIIFNNETSQTKINVTGLLQDQIYYWRVFPKNQCGTATSATSNLFRTGVQNCNFNYTATDFSNSAISSNLGLATIPVQVTDNFSISDLTVSFNITHPAVQELKVFLEAPAGLNIPDVLLINQSCGSFPNINANVKDSFGNLVCSTTSPAISGNFKPYESLIGINNKLSAGTWKLKVTDDIVDNGGQVNSFSLSFCNTTASLSNQDFVSKDFKLYPNPAENYMIVELNDTVLNASISIFDIQGRLINTRTDLTQINTIDISNYQSGVYLVKLNSDSGQITKRFIKK